MIHEDCIYFGICEQFCTTSCLRYEEMKYLLESSNIPRAKQKINTLIPDECDVPAFEKLSDIRDNIVSFAENGNNLYLFSESCGNGKTTWAIKLLLQYFNEVWAGNNFRERGVFINVNTFLFDLKDSFNKYNENVEVLKRLIPSVDLVVWDDIVAGRLSQYDLDLILGLLDKRIISGRANIFTGNLLPSQLCNQVGYRLQSRICGSEVEKIELRGGDRR